MRRAQGTRRTVASAAWGMLLAGVCGVWGCKKDAPPAPSEAPVTMLGPENVAQVRPYELRSGPGISGTLQARTAGAVRAQVGGTVLDIEAQQGQVVKQGEELARIDDATLKDQLIAARTAVGTARNALRVAEAEEERSAKLSRAGVITPRDFERAQLGVTQAKGQLAEARSRLALAQEQLGRTRVVAPFAGVVSERQASAGDVVQPGSPMFTVVDPRTLRLEASVPAARLDQVKVGTPVEFQVTGYGDREFIGKVERINPVVDPNTGQVRIYVAIPNTDLQLLAGLFAQGRVASREQRALAVPQDAIDDTGETPSVLRVKDEKVARVPVTLGMRDEVARRVEVRSGLQDGDVVLLGAARDEVSEGARVQIDTSRRGEPVKEDEGPGVGGSEAPTGRSNSQEPGDMRGQQGARPETPTRPSQAQGDDGTRGARPAAPSPGLGGASESPTRSPRGTTREGASPVP
ncbi:efflux RND transporter periplasmic adaptor subunit [Myxococcus stipitatus]|uniref:efflux RND transporter periplasmic adaptor subunit n=1 Tax=Myxococcus stipitatus TaxID=83455 RepID=UPI001F309FA2|nr:efflux RND transporter periplasmic adaptor subunit [Myxococcus stipitatus]MCE9669018.1 efflux RND transporter periplasmic adaptor subunit [Myxococcus stipitatus]